LGAPIIAVLLLTSIAFGLIARTVPQMNVFFVAMPLKLGVGLLFIGLCLPYFSSFLKILFSKLGDTIMLLIKAASSSGQERTEKATPKRRQQSRKKGQVAQSREIPSVLILMTVLGVFYFAGSWMFLNISGIFGGIYQELDTLQLNTVSDVSAFSVDIFKMLFSILIPFFVPILIAGLAGNIGQVGFEMHSEPLRPKLAKINPIAGFKKFVSMRSLVELGKSIMKLLIIGGISYGLIKAEKRK
jgi:flagellar biosynthesis protein FlhB